MKRLHIAVFYLCSLLVGAQTAEAQLFEALPGLGKWSAVHDLYGDEETGTIYLAGGNLYSSQYHSDNLDSMLSLGYHRCLMMWQNGQWTEDTILMAIQGGASTLAKFKGKLYATGPMITHYGTDRLFVFEGGSWQRHSYAQARRLIVDKSDKAMYLMRGQMPFECNDNMPFRFDGDNFYCEYPHIDNGVGPWAITEYGGQIYVGGKFNIDQVFPTGLARWNGQKWVGVPNFHPGGFCSSCFVSDMVEYKGKMYILGELIPPSSPYTATPVIAYDGQQFERPGGELLEGTGGLPLIHNGYLYISGWMTHPTRSDLNNHLVRFDGQEWSSIGDFSGQSLPVMTSLGNDLYFASQNDTYVNGINYGRFFRYRDTTTSAAAPQTPTEQLRLSPNPARDLLRWDLPPSVRGDYQLRVQDMAGRTLKSQIFSPQASPELPLVGWQAGVYLLTLSEGDKLWRQRFVKLAE